MVLASFFVFPTSAQATPVRNTTPWAILLCRFSDQPQTPQQPQFFRDMFTASGSGRGGLFDYWHDVSQGRIDLTGSVVVGWYNEKLTLADEQKKSRWDKTQDCVDTAKDNGYSVPDGSRIAVMVNTQIDSGSVGGRVLLDPGAWNVTFAAHEMGHGYGLNHSFSDDTSYKNASWSQPGEYDDEWDIMSAMHVFTFAGANYGTSGPGLIAPYMDRLGWLPRSRILTFGADGTSSRTLTLDAVNQPTGNGSIMVRVPFDPANPYRYYTVEYRRKVGWDRGIPADTVLIHEIRDNGIAYLLRQHDGGARAPIQTLNDTANNVSITVNSINGATATVTIRSGIADRCLQGYVWREANASDHVCVTGAIRSQTRYDNSQADARRQPGGGPFGPDTCKQGYVWREAYSGDHVCVTPQTRTQAADDNKHAAERHNPARFVYGPNTCKQGYVWREADDYDYVCVTGAIRSQTRYDNSQADARRQPGGGPFGPDTCKQGYVWREAYSGDHVCVTPQTRTQAADDNKHATERVARP